VMPVMLVVEDRIVEWLPWLTGANFMWGEKTPTSTRNVLTFVNTTAIAYRQNSAFLR